MYIYIYPNIYIYIYIYIYYSQKELINFGLRVHVFLYKYDVYKHIQAQVWRFFKHMLSIMLSLAKHYHVKHFFGLHEFFHNDYDFFC